MLHAFGLWNAMLAADLPLWTWAVVIVAGLVAVVNLTVASILIVRQKKRLEETPQEEPKEEPVEEPQEEPAEEPVEEEIAPAEEPAEEPVAEPVEEPVEEPAEEPAPVLVVPVAPVDEKKYPRVRYDKSFTAKLMQSDDKTKERYSILKNDLLSYGVKGRISWNCESFRLGRTTAVRFLFRGKTLCVAMALDPNDYLESKYKIEDISNLVRFERTPLLYRMKNDRRARYCCELFAVIYEGKAKGESAVDFVKEYPFRETNVLVHMGLIRVLGGKRKGEVSHTIVHEVKAEEVSTLLDDSYAREHIEEGDRVSDKSHKIIVNVDDLSDHFAEGETVTVEEIVARIPGVNKHATYVKVLARGTLDKALTVEADDFSVDAVKMILLTGGKVVRRRER